MRAKEFIVERELPKRKSSVLPGTKAYPGMPSANPYEIYRFGMAMANHEIKHAQGPASNYAVISTYAPEEEEIVKAAEKATGHRGEMIADPGSHEPNSTDTQSPVAKVKRNRFGV